MSRTIRKYDQWNEYINPQKMQTDQVRRTHIFKSKIEHLGEYFGEDVWVHKKQLRKQLQKQDRLKVRQELRKELF
jgi:hypothetical protein